MDWEYSVCCLRFGVLSDINTSFWLLIGGGVKLLPMLLLPRVFRPKDLGVWLALGLILILTWPFLEQPAALLTAILTYSKHWSFNGSFFQVLAPILHGWTRPILAGLGVAAVVYAYQKEGAELCRLAFWICGASILFSPTVHPWYVLWAWVPALLCGNRSWTVMATLVPLSHVALLTLDPITGSLVTSALAIPGDLWYLCRECWAPPFAEPKVNRACMRFVLAKAQPQPLVIGLQMIGWRFVSLITLDQWMCLLHCWRCPIGLSRSPKWWWVLGYTVQ